MPPVRMRFVVLALLTLCLAPAAARAQTNAPDAEEYAVWSAVLGHLYGKDARRVVVEGATFVPLKPFEVDPGVLSLIGMPAAVVDSLDARSLRAVPIDHRRLRAGRTRVVGQDEWEEGMTSIRFSRVAFDEPRTRAVVNVFMTCGMLCGSGGVVEVRRDEHGRWRFVRHLTMSFA